MGFNRKLCQHCKGKLEEGEYIHEGCIEGFAAARQLKADRKVAKQEKMLQKADRAETARRKEAIKGIPELTREAQVAFNAFIRARDQVAGFPCISSGRPLDWSGNAVDAGHFRSTGAAPHLRFNEDNCHAQSKFDNQWRAGNAVDYRIKLIERIGLERVEALECNNQIKRWTKPELIEIRYRYRAKARELKKSM